MPDIPTLFPSDFLRAVSVVSSGVATPHDRLMILRYANTLLSKHASFLREISTALGDMRMKAEEKRVV